MKRFFRDCMGGSYVCRWVVKYKGCGYLYIGSHFSGWLLNLLLKPRTLLFLKYRSGILSVRGIPLQESIPLVLVKTL
jgi:hypothetical protein